MLPLSESVGQHIW